VASGWLEPKEFMASWGDITRTSLKGKNGQRRAERGDQPNKYQYILQS
jgi:hypothetical protein